VALTVAIPAVSLLIGFLLVWPYVTHLRQVREELERTKTTIAQKKQVISQAEAAAQGRPLATAVAAATEEEPIVFLKQLAALTQDSGATLAAVRAMGSPRVAPQEAPRPYGTEPAPQTTPAPPAATPGQRPVLPARTVRELQDQVTVEGTFGSILALLVHLENYDRILSVSQCRLRSGGNRTYPRLQAVFTLSRFVAATPTPPTGTAAPAATPPAAAQ
jgi:hypothetical protein